jgi:hypothetical protein
VRHYLEEEAEVAQIFAVKLGVYFEALPREVELFSNIEITSQYPEEEDQKYLAQLDLFEQIRQVYSEERKDD